MFTDNPLKRLKFQLTKNSFDTVNTVANYHKPACDRLVTLTNMSRRAQGPYWRSDSSKFARTTMPIRSTISSSTHAPSRAAKRGWVGASSKRRSKPRIALHRGISSSL